MYKIVTEIQVLMIVYRISYTNYRISYTNLLAEAFSTYLQRIRMLQMTDIVFLFFTLYLLLKIILFYIPSSETEMQSKEQGLHPEDYCEGDDYRPRQGLQ